MSFPLYDKLVKELKSNSIELSRDDLNALCCSISQADLDHSKMIFAIIYHHALINKGKINKHKCPYSSKKVSNKGGILVEIKNLPKELIKILYIYVRNASKQ